MVAFQSGLPYATDVIAKNAPGVVAKAKTLLGKTFKVDPKSINLGQLVKKDNGMYSQAVAEALVRSGAKADDLFANVPVMSGPEMQRLREHLVNLELTAFKESDNLARSLDASADIDTSEAVRLKSDLDRVENAIRVLGFTNVDQLWRVKVTLDHLNMTTVANFQVLRERQGRIQQR